MQQIILGLTQDVVEYLIKSLVVINVDAKRLRKYYHYIRFF